MIGQQTDAPSCAMTLRQALGTGLFNLRPRTPTGDLVTTFTAPKGRWV